MRSIFFVLALCPLIASAQMGGIYQIEKNVVASGGSTSFGGDYSLESTAGQSVAGGFIESSPYRAYSGFWAPSLSPTAAHVYVGGRVITTDGRGISHVLVTLITRDGTILSSLTAS